jgi:hypothetical protein
MEQATSLLDSLKIINIDVNAYNVLAIAKPIIDQKRNIEVREELRTVLNMISEQAQKGLLSYSPSGLVCLYPETVAELRRRGFICNDRIVTWNSLM